MANRSVTVYVDDDAGFVATLGGGSSSNRLDMEAGDVLTIYHNPFLGDGGTITVSGFSTNQFTSSSNMSLYPSNSSTRTIKASPTASTVNITCAHSGVSSGTIYLNVISSTDNTPDAFSLGANRTANPSQVTYFDNVTVTGIDVAVTASVTNGEIALQSGTGAERTFGSSKTVNVNDVVLTRSTAPSGYGQSKTVTLNIGGVTDSATLSTPSDPTSGTQINLGITSGAIDMDSILDLFMGQSQNFWGYTRPTDMGSLYRSGSYVPNISANSSVATSGAITLSSFYGSATSFYVTSVPSNKTVFIDTSGGGSSFTGNCYWELGVDWDVGYGVGQRYNCEIYYTVTQNIGSVTVNGGSGSYSINNKSISISKTASANTESFNSGTITVHYRSLVDTSVTGTTTMNYAINFFGP